MMSVLDKRLRIEMPDGSHWAVPVMLIAFNRAAAYESEFGGDSVRSLEEDTKPLFEGSEYEIIDWAANNMDWSDVADAAKQIATPAPEVDYQEGWVNGDKAIIG